jgi:hypothetical protein
VADQADQVSLASLVVPCCPHRIAVVSSLYPKCPVFPLAGADILHLDSTVLTALQYVPRQLKNNGRDRRSHKYDPMP